MIRDIGVGTGSIFKPTTFICSPIHQLKRKVIIYQREECTSSDLRFPYLPPETSNKNLNFKFCWERIVSVGLQSSSTSEANFDLQVIRDSQIFHCRIPLCFPHWGLTSFSFFRELHQSLKEPDEVIFKLDPQWCMRAHSRPHVLPFRVVYQTYLPTVCRKGIAQIVLMSLSKKLPTYLHHPQLQFDYAVLIHISPVLRPVSVSFWLLSNLFFRQRPLHPNWGHIKPLHPLYTILQRDKFRVGAQLNVLYLHSITGVQEYLHSLVDSVYEVHPK